jgi:hypothetical protein
MKGKQHGMGDEREKRGVNVTRVLCIYAWE